MSRNFHRAVSGQHLDALIDNAIEVEIGSTAGLPPAVVQRLRDVYRNFVPIYVETIRLKENHPHRWQPEKLVIDPEVVEDMLHFFSDYQHQARLFKRINRLVKTLLRIDPQATPHRYDECVDAILSDRSGTSILDTLVGR